MIAIMSCRVIVGMAIGYWLANREYLLKRLFHTDKKRKCEDRILTVQRWLAPNHLLYS